MANTWLLNHKVVELQHFYCALSQSFYPVTTLRLRLLRGKARALSSKNAHSHQPGWLRSRGQPEISRGKQAIDSLCVDSRPEGVHGRAAHSSCDLQAGFDKVATCAVHLFLTGEGTPWKVTSWSCYSPNLKITLLQRARCHLWAHYNL